MPYLIDPRSGDCEDDHSSTDKRPLLAIAGTMLAELSLIKLAVTWFLVVALPALVIGLTFPVFSASFSKVSDRVVAITGIGSMLVLAFLAAAAWFGLRPLFRLAESNFWALNSIVVQPCYALAREGLRHVAELVLFTKSDEATRARARSVISIIAGLICVAAAYAAFYLVWPHTRWDARFGELASVTTWIKPAIANAIVVVSVYFGVFSFISAISDALMDQPVRLPAFDAMPDGEKPIRVAHLSDLHVIAEPYGFRIESGRAGPQGNAGLDDLLRTLSRIDAQQPLDLILVTGDMTDAGRSGEWAAFFDALEAYPSLMSRMLIVPGNHDVNIVDRANPARLELPFSSAKRLRQMRTISAIAHVQGERVRVFDRKKNAIGESLARALSAHEDEIAALADNGSLWQAHKLTPVWADCFPLVAPPSSPDGLGVILLNSNADANFSFTNALGLATAEDVAAITAMMRDYPKARWIIALHHHLIEYPMRVKQFSERIGTSLINGSWLVRQLKPFSDRIIIMHGHRHVDWIGACGQLKIVSAPSPVMRSKDGAPGCFLVHSLICKTDGGLGLAAPTRHAIAAHSPALNG